MVEEVEKSIKVKSKTYKRLEQRRGFNGCVTFDDVINYVMDREEEANSK